jgi:hypothetical protein
MPDTNRRRPDAATIALWVLVVLEAVGIGFFLFSR